MLQVGRKENCCLHLGWVTADRNTAIIGHRFAVLPVMRGLAPNFTPCQDFGRFWPFVSKVAINPSLDEWLKLRTLVSFGVDLCARGGSHKSADAWAKIAIEHSAVLNRENSCKRACERGRHRHSLSELIASCREMVRFADR